MVSQSKNRSDIINLWLQWNGKVYDPSYLYRYITTGSGLGKVGSGWVDKDGEEQAQQHGYGTVSGTVSESFGGEYIEIDLRHISVSWVVIQRILCYSHHYRNV